MAYREVPIDISPYLEGGSDYARERVAVALDEELRFSGFARISGHGIPASVIAGLDDAMTTLFSLDDDDKQRWRYSESNRGWVPARHETQSLSLGVPSPTGLADWVEVFDVGISPPDYRHVQVEGIAYAESVWPDIPQFRRRVDTYFSEAGRVVHGVMHILGDALGLGRTFFDAYDDHAVDTLGMNWYDRSLATSPEDRGMSEHTDYGLVTLAHADTPGLQVLRLDDSWVDLTPIDGALVLLVGDLLAQLTNDRWPAAVHRAMPPTAPAALPRRSAFFFHDGNADAIISPIPSLVAPGSMPLYEPVLVEDHIVGRLEASRSGEGYQGARRHGDRVRAAVRMSA